MKWVFWASLAATALVGAIPAQAQNTGVGQEKQGAYSTAARETTQLPAATNIPPTSDELANFLKGVGDPSENLERDAKGNVVFLALRSTNANDRALFLASNLRSLRELIIQGRGRGETGGWTREGISQLRGLTNLEKLRFLCVSPVPSLKDGVFQDICSLGRLKSLVLVASYPQQSDYAFLTNLQNLVELHLSYATNFGDAELCLLTNMPKLRSVYFSFDAISRKGTNVFRCMPGLTHTTVYLLRLQQ